MASPTSKGGARLKQGGGNALPPPKMKPCYLHKSSRWCSQMLVTSTVWFDNTDNFRLNKLSWIILLGVQRVKATIMQELALDLPGTGWIWHLSLKWCSGVGRACFYKTWAVYKNRSLVWTVVSLHQWTLAWEWKCVHKLNYMSWCMMSWCHHIWQYIATKAQLYAAMSTQVN